MEKSVDLEYKPYLWDNWYLTMKNKIFGFTIHVIICDLDYDFLLNIEKNGIYL